MYSLLGFSLILLLLASTSVRVTADKVLVIGGAGFLGYHVSSELATSGAKVIVLDNFDSSLTDKNLREQRAKELQTKGVKVYHGRLSDMDLLEYFLKNEGLSGIVYDSGGHENVGMDLYVKERMQSFVSLLEVLVKYKSTRLVYVSYYGVVNQQSTVASNGEKVNFATTRFSAIKTSEDSFAETYCLTHGLNIVGIRPFYPYGPWAEPQTFVYNLSDSIQKGTKIQVPYYNNAPVQYSLTYGSDVAKALKAGLNGKKSSCGQVYDVGGEKGSLEDICKKLGKYLKKNADKSVVSQSSSPYVVDLAKAKSKLEFTAVTGLEDGIKNFVNWYLNKKTIDTKKSTVDRKLCETVRLERIKRKSEAFIKRTQDLREEWQKKATGKVARFYRERNYIFFPNVNSGRDERVYKGLSVEELKKKCLIVDECIGFTTTGGLKARVDLKEKWKKTSSGGLYLADIDVCQAGLHNCFGNHTCKHLGPSQFECGCAKGSVITKKDDKIVVCTQTEYIEGVKSEKEENMEYFDRVGGHFWAGTSGDTFTEKKGSTLNSEVILSYPDAQGDVEKLKAACLRTYHCEGFNVKDNKLRKSAGQLSSGGGEGTVAYVRNVGNKSI